MTGRTIDRRTFLELTAGAAGLALAGCESGVSKNPPNVLFVLLDQLRLDGCSVYGGRNIVTPNIDRLAREGVVFTNAVSTCPVCTPYRGMLQTGRYPTHSGILMNFVESSAAQNPRCLANVFGDAGYETGYIGKWHLAAGRFADAPLGDDRPACSASEALDSDFIEPGPRRLGYRHWQAYNFHYNYNNYWYYEDEPEKRYSDRYEADTETDQAIAFMEKCRKSARPFLLNVSPHPPHPPFDPEYTPAGYLEQVPEAVWRPPNVPPNDPASDAERRCYLAMIQNADDNLGRLLDYLDRSGLSENTIVVFTSDHGEMLGSQGRIQKMVPYAESINVPLIMRLPGTLSAGRRVDALQTPMDHFPTLCGLVGVSVPDAVDGRDLSGVIAGESDDDREAVLIGHYSSGEATFETGTAWPEWRGVRTRRHTYVRWLEGKEELFDNRADPYQMTNLVDSDAASDTLLHLRGQLDELLAAAHDDFPPGTDYLDWYDDCRKLVRTALGPVPS